MLLVPVTSSLDWTCLVAETLVLWTLAGYYLGLHLALAPVRSR